MTDDAGPGVSPDGKFVAIPARLARRFMDDGLGNCRELQDCLAAIFEPLPRFRVERGTTSDGRNTTWEVWDRGEGRNCRIARFDYNHPNSARAAQIEADRLNGEALL